MNWTRRGWCRAEGDEYAAIAGTILVAGLADPSRSYGIAMIVLAFIGLIGLGATIMLPAAEPAPGTDIRAPAAEHGT